MDVLGERLPARSVAGLRAADSLAGATLPRRRLPAIPATAAGSEPVFFYGTLLHPAVRRLVLGREPRQAELRPATLRGYGRVRAREASYPLLVPAPGAATSGLLLLAPSTRDIRRLNHFESGEYVAELRGVSAPVGTVAAWLFMGEERFHGSSDIWDLKSWAATEMPGFLARCAGWMADWQEIEAEVAIG